MTLTRLTYANRPSTAKPTLVQSRMTNAVVIPWSEYQRCSVQPGGGGGAAPGGGGGAGGSLMACWPSGR